MMFSGNTKLKRLSRDGFSLVELLVILTIVAVLFALLLPALQKARAIAQIQACASNMRQMGVGLVAYTNDWRVLPLFDNQGNKSSNMLINSSRQFTAMGRLMGGGYVGGPKVPPPTSPVWSKWPPAIFRCPGRDQHGLFASVNFAFSDYAQGWAAADDIFFGGIAGQRLRPKGRGPIYAPPGANWNAGAPLPTGPAYFSPTFYQYGVEWIRDFSYNSPPVGGAKILVVDAVSISGGAEGPGDIPHRYFAPKAPTNALLVDVSVRTIYNAFNQSNYTQPATFVCGNIRPWCDTGWGMEWWIWADSQVGAINAQNVW